MALVLTEEQQLIKDTAHEFLAKHAPISQLRELRDTKDARGYSETMWKQMAELGWSGIIFPEAFGGTDYGYQALGVIVEEGGRTLAASPLFATVILGGSAVLQGGTEEQKQDILNAVVTGDRLLALALEEGAHHNPYGAATTAQMSGEGYVLNGRKVFVLDGHVADQIIVVARTSGQPGDRAGLTLFLVDAAADGLNRIRTMTADSRNAAIVELKQVDVPASAVLGSLDRGADILDAVLDRARILISAEMLGAAQQAFDRTLQYLKERTQFGVLIGSFQALKHRAADMFCELELSRSVVLEALTALDEKSPEDVAKLASLAKAKLSDTLHTVSSEAIQMHGGIGMTDEFDIGFFIKRSRVCEQAFGTAAFHRDRYATLEGF